MCLCVCFPFSQVLLGELDKYTAVSPQRFVSISTASNTNDAGLQVTVKGTKGETVRVAALKLRTTQFVGAAARASAEWAVVVKRAAFASDGMQVLAFQ